VRIGSTAGDATAHGHTRSDAVGEVVCEVSRHAYPPHSPPAATLDACFAEALLRRLLEE
jgi:hypothetical protein